MNESKIKLKYFVILAFVVILILTITGVIGIYLNRPNLELKVISLSEDNLYMANVGYFYGDVYIKTDEDISDYLYRNHFDQDLVLNATGRVIGYRKASHDCWGVWLCYIAPVIELYQIDM